MGPSTNRKRGLSLRSSRSFSNACDSCQKASTSSSIAGGPGDDGTCSNFFMADLFSHIQSRGSKRKSAQPLLRPCPVPVKPHHHIDREIEIGNAHSIAVFRRVEQLVLSRPRPIFLASSSLGSA